MENLIEVCAGPNCAVFADKIKAEIDSLDCSFKIIKTACSKNCGNRFGPPVVRINGDIFQGEIVLQKLREIILSPQSFTASFASSSEINLAPKERILASLCSLESFIISFGPP